MDLQSRFYDLFSQVAKKPGGYGTLGIVTRAVQTLSERYDTGYMAQLWFPDFYPASPLPGNYMIPTVCFKLTDYFSVDPDPNGNFALYFNPEATRPVSRTTRLTEYDIVPKMLGIWNTDVQENGWADSQVHYLKFTERIGDYYDQYRLTGASIALEYTGTIQEHSGYLVCGLFPTFVPQYCNLNSLRKSQYVQEVHPMEGIRAIWFPKDVSDDTFKYPGNRSSPALLRQAILGYATADDAFTDPERVANLEYHGITGADQDDGRYDINQPQVIIIYGTGLPTTTGNKFRGKIVRNFEGIPKPEAVDYVGAHNHKTNPETLDAVAFIAERLPELAMLPLEVTGQVRTLLDDKYSFLRDAVDSMKQYGTTLTTSGGQYVRGQSTGSQFVNFLNRALQ